MEPMMRAILGSHFDTVEKSAYERVQRMSREFIDCTTGVQTLVQMQRLVDTVRQGGFVTETEILDEHGYKHQYNESGGKAVLADIVDGKLTTGTIKRGLKVYGKQER